MPRAIEFCDWKLIDNAEYTSLSHCGMDGILRQRVTSRNLRRAAPARIMNGLPECLWTEKITETSHSLLLLKLADVTIEHLTPHSCRLRYLNIANRRQTSPVKLPKSPPTTKKGGVGRGVDRKSCRSSGREDAAHSANDIKYARPVLLWPE
jgi:hypothetical protein